MRLSRQGKKPRGNILKANAILNAVRSIKPFLTDASFASEQGRKILKKASDAARKKAELMIEQGMLDSLEAEVTQAAREAAQGALTNKNAGE